MLHHRPATIDRDSLVCCDGRLLLRLVKNGTRADTTGLVSSTLSASLITSHHTRSLLLRLEKNGTRADTTGLVSSTLSASLITSHHTRSRLIHHVTIYCTKESNSKTHHDMVAWLSGNELVLINTAALHRTRLVFRWVTVCGRVNHLSM